MNETITYYNQNAEEYFNKTEERIENKRYYVDLDERAVRELFNIASLKIEKIWSTADACFRGCNWINVIGKKVNE